MIIGRLSPLLLLDYAAPHEFLTSEEREFSQRSWATSASRLNRDLAYQGEVEQKIPREEGE